MPPTFQGKTNPRGHGVAGAAGDHRAKAPARSETAVPPTAEPRMPHLTEAAG